MKRIIFFIIIFLMVGVSFSQTIGDMLLDLSGDASEETEEVQNIARELFNNIQIAIDETNKITEELNEISSQGNIIDLETKETVKKRIINIHKVYLEINEREEHYRQVLDISGKDSKGIYGQTVKLVEQEALKLKKIEKTIEELERKGNISNDEKNKLRANQTKKNLQKIIVEVLNDFNIEMSEFQKNHAESSLKINDFFSQVRYSTEVTTLMIEVVDLSIKTEMILENLQSLNEIQKYTQEMYESLDILSKSLNSLKKLAERNQL